MLRIYIAVLYVMLYVSLICWKLLKVANTNYIEEKKFSVTSKNMILTLMSIDVERNLTNMYMEFRF